MLLLRIVAGVVASGALFLLALPPADFGILGWIALVPLLWSVANTRFIYGFAAGLMTCLFSAFLAAQGLFHASSIEDGTTQWIYTGFVLFGWIVGIVAGATAELKTLNLRNVLGIAALGVVMELVTMFILPAHIALTQYRFTPALGLASIGGIWAVSLIVWLANIGLAAALAKKQPRLAIGSIGICAACIALGLAAFTLIKGEPIRDFKVALVQTESRDIDLLAKLNKKGIDSDVSVWPELAAMDVAQKGYTARLISLAKEPGQPSFITSFRDGNIPLPHNTASIFSPKGESARYFKRKPFSGEKMIHLAGVKPLVVDHNGTKLGLNICFDSCYPAVMRETQQEGAEAILLPTQDPRSPSGIIQAIHAAYTPFRAAELGIPIARTDMSAYSMLVGATGEIVAQAGSGTEEVLLASTPLRPHFTLYKALGDWFLYVCALILIWTMVSSRRQSAKERLMQDVEEVGMTWNLYYDGGCNLCHMSKLRAEKWAQRAGQPLHVEILQSEEAMSKGYDFDNMILEADGKVYTRSEAWLRIMAIAPWYLRWLGSFRKLAVTRAIAKFFYEIVAKIRFIIFGRRACPIPPRRKD